jgi:hypothetical protein
MIYTTWLPPQTVSLDRVQTPITLLHMPITRLVVYGQPVSHILMSINASFEPTNFKILFEVQAKIMRVMWKFSSTVILWTAHTVFSLHTLMLGVLSSCGLWRPLYYLQAFQTVGNVHVHQCGFTPAIDRSVCLIGRTTTCIRMSSVSGLRCARRLAKETWNVWPATVCHIMQTGGAQILDILLLQNVRSSKLMKMIDSLSPSGTENYRSIRKYSNIQINVHQSFLNWNELLITRDHASHG